jgi:pyruvate-formate lyase-activating enzyme
MATWTDGSALLCCVAKNSEQYNLNDQTVKQIWNSEHWKDARKKMLAGEKVSACDHCYKEEAAGIRSHRINENVLWTRELGKEKIDSLIEATQEDGTLDEDLITLDLRLGNTCNLQCVMCRPQDSSMWLKPGKKLVDILATDAKWDWKHKIDIDTTKFEWYKKENLWQEFEPMFANIRHMIFAGGEPLLIKEHFRLLKRLVETGHSKHINLRYHTNGTTLPQEILELWKEFSYVELMVSLDAWGEHHDYVRYPADWSIILNNLKTLDNTPDNIEIKILCTVHALNIFYIPEFANNLLNCNFKKIGMRHHNGLFHAGTVHWPRYLCTQVFPKEIKKQIRDKWESNTTLYELPQWKDKISQQLNFMDQEDLSELYPQFLDYIQGLDTVRNTSFKDTFTEFYNILGEYRGQD